MELIKYVNLTLLTLIGIINVTSAKLDLSSQSVLSSDSKQEITQTQTIEVYKDKTLTQKLLSFDNVGYIESTPQGGIINGLVFDTTHSKNAGIAKNYFSDKSTTVSETQLLVRFSNFNKCEIQILKRPNLNQEVISIGLVSNSGTLSYISITFPIENKQDKSKISDSILKQCNQYVETVKKSLDEFWKEVNIYWKTKGQVQSLADKIKQTTDKDKVMNDLLSQIVSDKNNFEKSVKEAENKLNSTKHEMDEIQKKLKEEYKILNTLKQNKAANEKNLTNLNHSLSDLNNETTVIQSKLAESNEKSNAMRNRSDEIIKQISNVRNEMNGLEKNLTDERSIQQSINQHIDKLEKEINENGRQIAKLNKDIKINKDFLDKLALEDLPNVVNKTKSMVNNYKHESEKMLFQANEADSQIQNHNKTINNTLHDINTILTNQTVIKLTNKSKIKKNIAKAKVIYDTVRKIFPIIPDVFMNNLFNFISLNHYEGLNYIHGIKPSYFGLYDHLFSINDPTKTKMRAKKLRKMKKLRKLKKKF